MYQVVHHTGYVVGSHAPGASYDIVRHENELLRTVTRVPAGCGMIVQVARILTTSSCIAVASVLCRDAELAEILGASDKLRL